MDRILLCLVYKSNWVGRCMQWWSGEVCRPIPRERVLACCARQLCASSGERVAIAAGPASMPHAGRRADPRWSCGAKCAILERIKGARNGAVVPVPGGCWFARSTVSPACPFAVRGTTRQDASPRRWVVVVRSVCGACPSASGICLDITHLSSRGTVCASACAVPVAARPPRVGPLSRDSIPHHSNM